jgi:Beta-lactamase enzyme family
LTYSEFPGASAVSLVGLLSQGPTSLVALATFGTERWKVTMSVDSTGLINGLLLTPFSALTSWAEIDKELESLAPDAGFLAAQISDGACTQIHEVASTTPRPLASEFKLFVLGALAQQIASGRVAWSQQLTVQDSTRSIGNAVGSGSLQFSPTGTKVSVQEAATKMISLSDNTAADMLINLVGRSAVESQVRRWSSNPGLDNPFLTTRELFLLHYVNYPTLANRYLALSSNERSSFLASSVDPLSLSEVNGSTEPHDIDTLEWFASPDDTCRVFVGLRKLSDQPRLSPLSSVLSLNSGSLGLSRDQYPTVWFKGGSEPGVLTLGYLVKTRDGRTFVVSAMLSNPRAALSSTATVEMLGVVKGAIGILADSTHSN